MGKAATDGILDLRRFVDGADPTSELTEGDRLISDGGGGLLVRKELMRSIRGRLSGILARSSTSLSKSRLILVRSN